MENIYEVNNIARFTGNFVDENGTALDPTAVFVDIVEPDATSTTYTYGTDAELIKDSTGNYHIDITLDATGTWTYKWYSTGTGTASNTEYVYVYDDISGITTLFDMMLNVASSVYDVYEGTASTTGTTTTLVDSSINIPRTEYDGGSIFFTSGAHIHEICRITQILGTTITFTPAIGSATLSGNTYSIVPASKHDLMRAVNQVLRTYEVLKNNTSLVVVANQEEYNVPAGIREVRKVEIAEDATSPYDYQYNYYWHQRGNKLVWDSAYVPDATAGNLIRLWYYAPHGALDELTDVLEPECNLEYVKWASIINILRSRLQNEKRDDPVLVDLLNEAKSEFEKAKAQVRILPKDARIL